MQRLFNNKKHIALVIYISLLPGISLSAFNTSSQQDVSSELKTIINKELLRPLRAIEDSLSLLEKFQSAYTVGSLWKYEIKENPTNKKPFYQCRLREFKGNFIINQVDFRLYYDEQKIRMEEWESNKYISVKEWLKLYAAQNK